MNGGGVFLGVTTKGHPRLPVVYPGDGHVLTIAAPGSGKSRGVVVPNLINSLGSVVVTDVKGELTTLTSLFRSAVLGQKVVVFDPMHVVDDKYLPHVPKEMTNSTDVISRDIPLVPVRGHFDPIDFIIHSRSPITAGYRVAEGFIPPGGTKETHWTDGAQNYLNAIMQFVSFDPKIEEVIALDKQEGSKAQGLGRNMKTVWKILSEPALEKWAIERMVNSNDAFVSDQAAPFYKASKANTELQGIRNHVRVNLAKTLGERRILESLTGTNVDFSKMSTEPQSVYFVLPGDMAQTHFRYVRLLNAMVLSEIERGGLRQHGSVQPPTLFEMDEFATLGNFPLITEALGRMRGFGVKFHLHVQTISQLKATYGEGMNVITGTTGAVQFFGGTNDDATEEFVSKRTGMETIITGTDGQGQAPNSGHVGHATAGRRLKMPDEVGRLALPTQIIKIAGKNVVFAEVAAMDFSDFPQYSQFMHLVTERGVPAKKAARIVEATPWFRPPFYPPPPPPPAPPKQQPKSVWKLLDDLIATLMKHEAK